MKGTPAGNIHLRLVTGVLMALLGLVAAAPLRAAEPTAAAIEAHITALTQTPHRLAGSQEGRLAGDYIIAALRARGIEALVQRFPVTQLAPVGEGSYIEVGGVRFAAQPLQPNGIALPVTGPEGLTAEAVYLGSGDWEELAARGVTRETLVGRIAVLDFDSGSHWTRAVTLGAAGVVFVGPATQTRGGRLWVNAHAAIPRLLVSRVDAERAGLLTDRPVLRMVCEMTWARGEGRNIVAIVPPAGSHADGADGASPGGPAVVLTAPYDTFGPLPFHSPQPRKAANVAMLLEMTEPAAVTKVLVFHDNWSQDQAGVLAFQAARAGAVNPAAPDSLVTRLRHREHEAATLAASLEALADPEALLAVDASTYTGWHAWGPPTIALMAAFALLALVIWLLVDLLRKDKPLRERMGGVAWRSGAVLACIALMIWGNTRQGAGATRQGQAAMARVELLAYIQLLHEEAQQHLSDLRFDRVTLEQNVATASRAIEVQRDLGQEVAATLEARLARSEAELARHSPELEVAIAHAEAEERRLAAVRLAMLRGELDDDRRPLMTKLVEQRRALLQSRLDEIAVEIEQLQSDLNLAKALAPYTLVAAAVLDTAPAAGRRWTLGVPSASSGSGMLANGAMTRWISQWQPPADLTTTLGAALAIATPGAEHWSVWGNAAYLLHFAGGPEAWPDAALPGEAAADSDVAAAMAADIERLLATMMKQEALLRLRIPAQIPSFHFSYPLWDSQALRYSGSFVRRYAGSSVEAEAPVAGAVVMVQPRHAPGASGVPRDVFPGRLLTTTAAGTFPIMAAGDKRVGLMAATFDSGGRITGVNQVHPEAGMAAAGDWAHASYYSATLNNQVPLFDATPIILTGVRSQALRPQAQPDGIGLLQGLNNVAFPRRNISHDEPITAAYVGKLREFKITTGAQLVLGNDADDAAGQGYPQPDHAFDALAAAARDVWVLNESRLSRLRTHGILRNDLEALHNQAQRFREDALAVADDQPGLARALLRASQAASALVYTPIRSITNDLIRAVVILLLLAIPFSFAIERVVIGTPNIYRQLGGFAAIFLAAFGILYVVHPAFRFATFPVVVLLAFVIIIMSGLVIAIMWAKFEHEVKMLQGIATASHRSTRNARQTLAAAVAQGIASMRRRPLRTTLTALTITLLTFTIMFFGALEAQMGVRSMALGPTPLHALVEVQPVAARALDETTAAGLQAMWEDRGEVFARRWDTAPIERNVALPAVLPDGTLFGTRAWMVIDPRDLALYPGLASALTGDLDTLAREGGVILPRTAVRGAPAESGAIIFRGEQLPVRGTFDPELLRAVVTLAGGRFVPPDLPALRRELELRHPRDAEAVQAGLEQADPATLPLVDPESVLLIVEPDATRAASLAPARTLIAAAQTDQDAMDIARQAATLLGDPIMVASGGQSHRLLYVTSLSVAGMSRIITPLILGGLIILGTMLSSVTDREKEIFTLAALGLAPVHVGMLFFAEAAVYSVVGGMSGYLLSQVFAKVAEALAKLGYVEAPAANYSSISAIFTILLVMATVLASTIYPAMRASKAANPGVQRKWRMPEPDGDNLDIEFPFTVSAYDIVGLISFLEEYFLSHHDRSVGSFAAEDVQIEQHGEKYVLRARVFLQPFDQGVSQTFRLETAPSDIEGIDLVYIHMQRLSGPPAIWRRGNHVFVDDLRQQFIFWRTIEDRMIEHYHAATLRKLGLTQEAPTAS